MLGKAFLARRYIAARLGGKSRTSEFHFPPCAPDSCDNRVWKHILYSVSGIVGTVRIDKDAFTGTADRVAHFELISLNQMR